MRVIVVLVVLARIAAAESPLDAKLGVKSSFLGDRLRVALPVGSDADHDHAVFDWGTAILTIHVLPTFGDSDLRAAVRADARERDIDVAHARFESLDVAPLAGVLVIPKPPRKASDPDLVAAAYLRFPDGGGAIVAFYIDVGGLDGVAMWTRVARRIAETVEATEVVREHVVVHRFALELPRRYAAHTSGLPLVDVKGPAGTCTIIDRDEASAVRAPGDASIVVGTVAGHTARWAEWARSSDFETELYDARLDVRVLCIADTREALATLRSILASLH